ncbi:UDP-N-acetylglucosamine 2-epimerase [Aestuariirhabdus haliotis]|nr:UDP-N-acetylglucosamine 2-epimerase [Aestuariirhabdus haliotis]
MQEMSFQNIPYKFVLTGQHEETMQDLIEQFSLPSPEYLLPLRENDTKSKLITWLFLVIFYSFYKRGVWADVKYCLVHGDTLSTLLGAVLSKVYGVKVVHVEAGLRSYNWRHPFPEEVIRVLVGKCSDVFFCADSWASKNVKRLRSRSNVLVEIIGANTLLDSLDFVMKEGSFKSKSGDMYCVVSIHRYENLSNRDRLEFILAWVEEISNKILVKFVLHPTTIKAIESSRWLKVFRNNPSIELVPRMNYAKFIQLLSRSQFLVTDGGSNQEECSYLHVPCLLFRDATERNEGIGEWVVLSKMNNSVVKSFLDNVLKGKVRRVSDNHLVRDVYPSKNIVNYLESLP